VGEGTRTKVGQKVVLAPGLSCGACDACLGGLDNQCRRYTIFGYMVDGGCAEYVRAPERNVLPMPSKLSFEDAAAVPLVFQTSWHMLMTRAGLRAGEDVLVLGAGSGIGSAAIQIAKLAGARASPPRARMKSRSRRGSWARTEPSTTPSRTSPRKPGG
jgi:NADPH:quinone reductase-like Zn-dependent oxidoreductase